MARAWTSLETAPAALPKSSFIAYNCDSGRQLAGRLF